MKPQRSIRFGTSGWRAILAEDFTLANVKLVVAAIARYLCLDKAQDGGVIVGRDTRFLGDMFTRAAVEVLAAHGVTSYYCAGPVPTPVMAFEILRRKASGGINFTASHNPAEYNGLKFTPAWGGPALPATTRRIEQLIEQLKGVEFEGMPFSQAVEKGLCCEIDPREEYLKGLAEKVQGGLLKKAGLRVALDHMHGTSAGYLDLFLKRAGVTLRRFHQKHDPYFGGARPDPAEENLGVLISLLKRDSSFHLGLATDGDADRFGVVDRNGVYFEANVVCGLLLDYMARTRGFRKGVVRSVSTTHFIDAVAAKHGLPVYETKVGFKYVGQFIATGKADVACEESAGFTIKGHVPEKDGILACVLTAEMVAVEGKSLAKLREKLFKQTGPFYTQRQDIPFDPAKRRELKARLNSCPDRFAGKKVENIVRLDGTKFILRDGAWALARESGTEPLVRLYGEARFPAELAQLMEAGRKLVTG